MAKHNIKLQIDHKHDRILDALGISEERINELNVQVCEYIDKQEPEGRITGIFERIAAITETAEEYTYLIYKIGKTDGLADTLKEFLSGKKLLKKKNEDKESTWQ